MNLKRFFQRYNPRRKYIELDDEVIALMSQLGYVELYRGEWFFTNAGAEALIEGAKEMQRNADIRS